MEIYRVKHRFESEYGNLHARKNFVLERCSRSVTISEAYVTSDYHKAAFTLTLRKMPLFYLISWCGNFVERHSFRIVSTPGN